MAMSEFNSRIEKASEILKVDTSTIKIPLETIGISDDGLGIQLLEAETTTEDMLKKVITEHSASVLPLARLSAAICILRGQDPFLKKNQPENITSTDALLKNMIPLAQRKDRDLLESFILEEDSFIQEELHKRACGKPFIVMGNNNEISLDISLELLKKARKGENIPNIIPIGGYRISRALVFPIQKFRKENRVQEESPLIPNQALFDGYCEVTDEDFKTIEIEARQFMRLVVDYTNSSEFKNSKFHSFNLKSFSDRKALMVSASNGIEDLRRTWPSVALIFDDKKEMGTLPSLKIVNPIVRKKSDPFHQNGNTTY